MSEPATRKKDQPSLTLLSGRFPPTDLGNAERLVALNRGDIRYCADRRRWLVWSGDRWKWDSGTELHRRAKAMVRNIYHEAGYANSDDERKALSKHAAKSEAAARINACIEMARFEEGVPIEFHELDSNPWLLNCLNGTLDLRTATLKEHDRSDLITKTTGLEFDISAQSPLWGKVLNATTDGDEEFAGYLQRVAGYACSGLATERAFWLFYGPPATGKSTVIDGLNAALGDYAISADCETFLAHTYIGGNRGDLVRLAGTRLVVGAEIRKGARWDESIVKRITGGDELVASAKYEGEVSFRVSCTLILAANDAPMARDDDAGFWARCQRVPFQRVIPEDERVSTLKEQLREPSHAAAILAWAVQGCLEWQRDGIGTCSAVDKSTEEYRAESDHLGEFLAEEMVIDHQSKLAKSRFRDIYEAWCKANACKPKGDRELKARLAELGVHDGKSGSLRLWKGLRESEGGDQ